MKCFTDAQMAERQAEVDRLKLLASVAMRALLEEQMAYADPLDHVNKAIDALQSAGIEACDWAVFNKATT